MRKSNIDSMKVYFKFHEHTEFLESSNHEDIEKARQILRERQPIIFLKGGDEIESIETVSQVI